MGREALKQSATDPLTGRVDVTILTTGQSSSGRKRRQEVAAGLKALLRKKTKVGSINIDALLKEFKASADLQITRDMYEDALRDLQEEQVILRNRNNVRILTPAAGGDEEVDLSIFALLLSSHKTWLSGLASVETYMSVSTLLLSSHKTWLSGLASVDTYMSVSTLLLSSHKTW